ncbi:hypothetical protein BJP43_05535 [Candidatus Williamhamiltonella defendens]|uniref:Uncharacterized protein n=2 Tax=Candidatus Williamhamiltonella defendens TaxID=138072 RepID=A0A2D3TDG0_9ENTR|nr:hypothetical protein BJP43_05535 [Candidatus Hamiltonella defensa]
MDIPGNGRRLYISMNSTESSKKSSGTPLFSEQYVRNQAELVVKGSLNLNNLNLEDLSNLADYFIKHLNKKDNILAIQKIAENILNKPDSNLSDSEKFTPKSLVILTNVFSKLFAKPDMKKAVQKIAMAIGKRDLSHFIPKDVANLASAFSKFVFDSREHAIFEELLSIHTFITDPRNSAFFDEMSLIASTMLLKACAPHSDLYPQIAAPMIKRIRSLTISQGKKSQNLMIQDGIKKTNLETLGNLCIALFPSLFQNRLKKDAFTVLANLFNHIQRKVELSSDPTNSHAKSGESYESRSIALTYYQLIKVYAQVAKQSSSKSKKAIEKWVSQMVEHKANQILDSSSYSWNLIAKLETQLAMSNTDATLEHFTLKHWKT